MDCRKTCVHKAGLQRCVTFVLHDRGSHARKYVVSQNSLISSAETNCPPLLYYFMTHECGLNLSSFLPTQKCSIFIFSFVSQQQTLHGCTCTDFYKAAYVSHIKTSHVQGQRVDNLTSSSGECTTTSSPCSRTLKNRLCMSCKSFAHIYVMRHFHKYVKVTVLSDSQTLICLAFCENVCTIRINHKDSKKS